MKPVYAEDGARIEVVSYGSDRMLRCSVCGDVQQLGQIGDAKARATADRAEAYAHRRHEHPTEAQREGDELRRAEWELPGCTRCGGDHDASMCPHVGREVYP